MYTARQARLFIRSINFTIEILQDHADKLEKQERVQRKNEMGPLADLSHKEWNHTMSHISVLRHDLTPMLERKSNAEDDPQDQTGDEDVADS